MNSEKCDSYSTLAEIVDIHLVVNEELTTSMLAPLMSITIVTRGEAFPSNITSVWLLCSVNTDMTL